MKEKITVEICTGTACFVMGGSDILLLEEHLPENLKDKVKIRGTVCMNICEEDTCRKAPFVRVNDIEIDGANIPVVIDTIRKTLKEIQSS